MFIPITAVLPSRLSPLPPLPRENISVCPHYRGITADYRGITVVPITMQLSSQGPSTFLSQVYAYAY